MDVGSSSCSSRTFLRRLCLLALAGVSSAMLALVARTMASRLLFPYELSKMEGYLVDHVRRVASGQPLYAAPSEQFVAFLYTPLFYWICAPLMSAGADGFIAARVVSLAALAGAVAVGMWMVRRAAAERSLCWLVPILFLSKYWGVHAFYDHARADNLMALFAVVSVAALTLGSPRRVVSLFVASGLLAFWTKQSVPIFHVALLLGYCLISWRVACVCAVGLFGSIVLTFLLMNASTDGWLFAYTIDAPGHHDLDHRHLLDGLRRHMLGSFFVESTLAALSALALFLPGRRPSAVSTDRERTRSMVVVAAVASGGFTVASLWQPVSVENVLILYAAITACLVPIVLSWGIEQIEGRDRRGVAWNLALVSLALVIAQGFRDPRPFHPVDRDVERWRALGTELAKYGPRERAWVTLHGSAWGGGMDSPTWVHRGALCDFVGGYFGRKTPYDVPQGLLDRIDEQYWNVILVADWDRGAKSLLEGRYQVDPSHEGLRLPAFAGHGAALERFWIPTPDRRAPFGRASANGACSVR